MDGLKESHRKILYATFIKNLKYSGKTMKVAQLAGFVAEKTNYHHGEQCLFDTITKLAHDFVGSNNIPLLFRDGQMGTRISMGKDAASARYIFTKLDMMTRFLFKEEDDELLDYIVDEGEKVEPDQYIPVIPIILINGCTGIGTGWSCNIPCYNPEDVISAIKSWIVQREKEAIEFSWPSLNPWYRGFKGDIVYNGEGKYTTWGVLKKSSGKVVVEELPIGMSIDKFKEFVEDLLENKSIKSYKNYSTTEQVNFVINESKDGILCNLENLKLKSNLSLNNMVLFTSENKIKKYRTIYEIMEEFCRVRFDYYVKRKKSMIETLTREHSHVSNRYRFINDVMNGVVVINNKVESEVIERLDELKYDRIDGEYRYLLDMKIRSFTREKLEELKKMIDSLDEKLKDTKATSEYKMWDIDLDELLENYRKWLKSKN
jgi:DNA topoisomerase-2